MLHRSDVILLPPLARGATLAAFFLAGFAMAAWAPLVPYAKARAGLDDGALGVLLLCLGAGSLVAMPLAGALAQRIGCRTVVVAAALAVSVALPVLATGSGFAVLAIALLLFGAGIGAIDVAVNIQAVMVERAGGRPMMSGFHGFFSIGGMAGAGGVSTLLWLGATPLAAVLVAAAVNVLLLAGFARGLIARGGGAGAPLFALPHGRIVLIAVLCFAVFLAEGAMLDWSAVFLTGARGVDPSRAGLGYAAFALAMTIGRLSGDRVVARLGGPAVMLTGAAVAASGLALAVLVAAPGAALAGFAMVGLGAANIVPVLYSVLGRQTAMPAPLAVAAVTTVGYAGILAGPALIGFVAAASSLAAAFALVALSLVLVGLSARVAAA
ncbi:MFS transporter [Phreatobacter sp. AB_2022a]|uniref:MFS transporter n=1 Tax=Phreatobacter sp. AB_2022a TaxID=3003134 RepID=UPI002286E024|nr:MFS transporter [Phreatobacter sp. AB_2022a]MCZ0736862.1 MFS transporter [Phreatobacter sp. AB_2022a]